MRPQGTRSLTLDVPAGVVAQVWSSGGRTARMAALLKHGSTEVVPLTLEVAKAAALLCRAAGTRGRRRRERGLLCPAALGSGARRRRG